MLPSSGTPSSSARRWPPPEEKSSKRAPGLRVHERAHVLDDTDDGHAHALEHAPAAQRVAHRHLLRSRHDDRAGHLSGLDQGELRVTGPRRQVHDEVVELAPVHIAQKLLDDLHDDGTAPDRGRVPIDEEAERHKPDAVGFERLNPAAHHRGPLEHTEHPRNVGAVDVGIHHTDPVARLGERDGEIRPRPWTCRPRPCPTRSR